MAPDSPIPEVVHDRVVQAQGPRLVAVAELPADGVVEVRTEAHGVLAVGMAEGRPFAVSNLCRHQFAKLGQGQVRDGCLECPWHRARYDVTDGTMVRGPQGRLFGFKPYSRAIQGYTNAAFKLKTFPVAVVEGAIVLT
ncbi:MAG: hcaC [Solirubrobacterales bacterium]|jgi:3-phenylpropionate/trans-cinnamate dioxygenase ferredoxin subunit|nr:hcaC [Solirubrobacterales bacterium]